MDRDPDNRLLVRDYILVIITVIGAVLILATIGNL